MRPRALMLLCLLCPPLAVVLIAPRHLLFNIPLTILGWLPGSVHAMSIVYHWCEVHDPLALAGYMQED
jgi:uncharacterized membrane protein YqaE (UPF0057 family)